MLVTPEYNYGPSGVLKNAIDWLSRMTPQPFAAKPIAMFGASGGVLGTARAQYQLRQIMVFLDGRPVNKPEVMIGAAQTRFADGKLTDEATGKLLGRSRRLAGARRAPCAGDQGTREVARKPIPDSSSRARAARPAQARGRGCGEREVMPTVAAG